MSERDKIAIEVGWDYHDPCDDKRNVIEQCADAVEESYDRGELPDETAIAVLRRFHSWLNEDKTTDARRIAARYVRAQIKKYREAKGSPTYSAGWDEETDSP